MKERVLITGASGFVGYHLIEAALSKDLEVYAGVRLTSKISHIQPLPIQFTYTDFSDPKEIRKDFEKNQYNYIIHAAGSVKERNRKAYYKSNAELTRKLALSATEAHFPLKKFIFISSLAAIGPSLSSDPITDLKEAKPITYYGKSKRLAESYLSSIPSLPLIVLRPTAVYGPRERDLLIFLKSISHGLELYIGTKKQQLSFVYVKDLAALTIDALVSPVTNKTYNISDGHSYDRYQLADITKKILQQKTIRLHIPRGIVYALASLQELTGLITGNAATLNREKIKELTAENWVCSIDNIQHDLGYVPKYDLKKGLTDTLHWYKENHWLN